MSPTGSFATPLNPRDYLILFALNDGPSHGYGLLKEVERLSGGQVKFDPANLYRTLKRMIGAGIVRESDRIADDDSGGAPRKYYEITKAGTRTLRAEATRLARLAELASDRNLVDPRV